MLLLVNERLVLFYRAIKGVNTGLVVAAVCFILIRGRLNRRLDVVLWSDNIMGVEVVWLKVAIVSGAAIRDNWMVLNMLCSIVLRFLG